MVKEKEVLSILLVYNSYGGDEFDFGGVDGGVKLGFNWRNMLFNWIMGGMSGLGGYILLSI